MNNHNCASQHFGPWMIEPMWFTQAVASVQSGQWQPQQRAGDSAASEPAHVVTDDMIAIVQIHGQVTKGQSSFGGTSSVAVRQLIRGLARTKDIRAIMLHVDSPGGTAAGTDELAQDVAEAGKSKLVHAHADDLMASAAYYVGSQASRVSVNRAGEVGSLGTVAQLYDTSGIAEAAGARVHVVSTGPYKGAFAPGAPITDEHIAYAQETVDAMNEGFVAAVKRGRHMTTAQARDLFHGEEGGKVWPSGRAMALGLVDAVESFDAAMAQLRRAVKQRDSAHRARQSATARKIKMAELK